MNNEFSENIKKIRKENHLSQEQLAEELGVSRQAISKWESGAAYPEMDKIIYICKKYNVNIDDLLHKDIKEVKGEEETKNNINKYIEEFFKFVTDSVNMFLRMKFGSKIKFLFEQGFIAFVLWFLCLIIFGLLNLVLSHSPLSMLPTNIFNGIEGFLDAVYWLVAFVICVIVMVRIYKSRYLDYYQQVVEEGKEESTTTVEKKLSENSDGRITLKEQSKIVVRDPKNSDYHLLRGLFKVFLLGVKAFVLWMETGLCFALGSVAFAFAMCFLVAKTGIFFVGCLLGCLSAMVALAVVIILLFNFVFNRKSNKKLMIWSFVGSIIVGGMSIGMVTIGSLNFEFVHEPKSTKVDMFEIDMNENSFINGYQNVEYIAEDRNNIKISVELNDLYTANYSVSTNGAIHLYDYPTDGMKLLRSELQGFNEKKIYPMNSDLNTIKVYASSANIEKLKTNYSNYNNEIEKQRNEIEELRKELDEKNSELYELKNKVNECNPEEQVEE